MSVREQVAAIQAKIAQRDELLKTLLGMKSMSQVKKKIEDIRAKSDRQKRLLKELLMWIAVEEQGIDPKDVKLLGYDPHADAGSGRAYRHGVPLAFNYVVLRDGSRVDLSPVPNPNVK